MDIPYAALGVVVRFTGSLCCVSLDSACNVSTSCDRKPCGNDIFGRIHVCVVRIVTRETAKESLALAILLIRVSTLWTT